MFDDRVFLDEVPEPIPAGLDSMPPGQELAAALASIDVNRVSGYDQVIVLRAHQRMLSHYQARSYSDMAAICDTLARHHDTDDHPMARADAVAAAATEIRAALRLTRRAADTALEMALDVTRRTPRIAEALAAGRIDPRRARTLVHGTRHLSDAAARVAVDAVVDEAPRLTTGQLAARLRRLCLEADPEDAVVRYETTVDQRRIVAQPGDDGTIDLCGYDLPPDRVAAAQRHIDRLAKRLKTAGEARSMDQLRADVYLDLLTGSGTPTRSGRGMVDIRVDLDTLARLTDAPGDLAGYGPVIADIARRVAERQAGSEWRYTVTEPDTGLVVDHGITRRRPTRRQRRAAQAIHPTCVFPGCRMPAVDCDLDHRIPYCDGGPTAIWNLPPLCRHDHITRHHHGWRYRPLRGGDFEWISPLGHRYTTSGRPP